MQLLKRLPSRPVLVSIMRNMHGDARILERQKADKLHHFSKLRKILHTVLNLLQSISDRVNLMDHFE